MEWQHNEFTVTCDPDKADLEVIGGFLSQSYWAQGIAPSLVRKSIEHSLNFILLSGRMQVGYARVVSDRATIGYLGDVFVLPEYRGRGLGKWLVECVLAHPELQGLRRWILATRDAHELYEKFGFTRLGKPELFMEKFNASAYQVPAEAAP